MAGEIEKALSDLLVRRTKDPRLAQVAITGVKLTPDLRRARVFFTLLDDRADRRDAERGLAHALAFLRRGVAAAVPLRYAPELEFAWDATLEGARRIEALLRGLQGPEQRPDPGAAGEGARDHIARGEESEPGRSEDAASPRRGPSGGGGG